MKVTLEEFKKAGKELLDALPRLSDRQVENGLKCFNILYLNLSNEDAEKVLALGIFDYINNKAGDRLVEIYS